MTTQHDNKAAILAQFEMLSEAIVCDAADEAGGALTEADVLTTVAGMVAHMSASTSADDWNRRRDEVKRANAGYPQFWFADVIMSGVASDTQSRWQ